MMQTPDFPRSSRCTFQRGTRLLQRCNLALKIVLRRTLLAAIDDGRMPWEPLDEDNIRSVDFMAVVDRRYAIVCASVSRPGDSGVPARLKGNTTAPRR